MKKGRVMETSFNWQIKYELIRLKDGSVREIPVLTNCESLPPGWNSNQYAPVFCRDLSWSDAMKIQGGK